jgi:hypothetical protein
METQKNAVINGNKSVVIKKKTAIKQKVIVEQEQVKPLPKHASLMRLVEALLKSPEKLIATIKVGGFLHDCSKIYWSAKFRGSALRRCYRKFFHGNSTLDSPA